MAASGAQDVKELMKRKDAIELEIKELHSVLESQQGVGMDGPLMDEEQYPRADIDIPTVRQARQRVIRLQNDHAALMKEIEEGLHKLHAESRPPQEEVKEPQKADAEASTSTKESMAAFAKVDRVDPGSPAATGGLNVGDQLVRFGSVTNKNFQNLQNISTVVQHGKGRPLPVTVLRDGQEVHMAITPRLWSGKGLLGCNILPVEH